MSSSRSIQPRDDVVVKTEEGSAGPATTNAADLPPLPRCKEHPRRELELYCKLCQTVMCSTCKETEHSQCHRKWDEKTAQDGLTQSIVFEGVERVARGLKEEVLGGLGAEFVAKEQALQEAAKGVAKRKREVEDQLAKRRKEVDAAEQALVTAMTQRFDTLRAELEAAAAEKAAALEEQEKELGQGATSLKGARMGAERTLSKLVVEEKPVEVVSACLKLKQEAAALSQASQASAPISEANLTAAFNSLNEVMGEVTKMGWCGALDVDVTKCTLSKQAEELMVGYGGSFDINVIARDKLGQQLKAGGLDVKANVQPKKDMEEGVVVEDKGDGTYTISFKSKDVEDDELVEHFTISIEICGSPIPGSPFQVVRSPSSIVIIMEDFQALCSFVPPRKRLELCYRASRDGWTAADFHRLCDNKGPTLVVAKEATKGYIFGGYTAVSWSSAGGGKNDAHAFLLSISNPSSAGPVKIPIRKTQTGYGGGFSSRPSEHKAVNHRSEAGPTFGIHNELQLLCDEEPRSGSSTLGNAYGPPPRQSSRFLAGSSEFQLAEVEVFLVK